MANILVRILGDTGGFDKSADKMNGKLKSMEGSTLKFGAALQNVGMIGAGAFVGATATLFKVGEELDALNDSIAVTTGASGEALDALQASARNLATTVPTDFASAGTAIADINQRLGLSGEALEGASASALEFTRLFGGELSENVRGASRVMGDWGIESSKMPETLDKIAKASQLTGISTNKLMESVVQFGAPLRQMGFDLETSIALLGKWEKEGVNTELVLGSLRIGLVEFSRVQQEATTQTDAAIDALIRSQDPADQFTGRLQRIAKDGASTQEMLNHTIAAIRDTGDASTANTLAVEVFGARAGPDMAAAIREGRFELGNMITDLQTSEGTVMNTSAATMDGAEKMQIAFNRMKLAAEPLAEFVFNQLASSFDSLFMILEIVRIRGFGGLIDILAAVVPGLQGAINLANAFGDGIAAWGGIFDRIGYAINRAWNTLIGFLRDIRNAPVVGGALSAIGIPSFHGGGVVPGPLGAPVLAQVHAGETIIPVGGALSGSTINNYYFYGPVGVEDIGRMIDDRFAEGKRRGKF